MHGISTKLTSAQSEITSKDGLLVHSPILCSPPTAEMEQMTGNVNENAYKLAKC